MEEPYFVPEDDIGWPYIEEAIGKVHRGNLAICLVQDCTPCNPIVSQLPAIISPGIGHELSL